MGVCDVFTMFKVNEQGVLYENMSYMSRLNT